MISNQEAPSSSALFSEVVWALGCLLRDSRVDDELVRQIAIALARAWGRAHARLGSAIDNRALHPALVALLRLADAKD